MDEGTSMSHWYESYQTTVTESNILVRNRIHALVTLCQQQHRVTVRPWGIRFRMGPASDSRGPGTSKVRGLKLSKTKQNKKKTVIFVLLFNVF